MVDHLLPANAMKAVWALGWQDAHAHHRDGENTRAVGHRSAPKVFLILRRQWAQDEWFGQSRRPPPAQAAGWS
jgi:hypothetical protein